ncbi:CP2 transcription factor [Histoplasma capsulatum var. duboisii H88]|uniref:CP2 transcription factor n=1 Tax=Ajellomyces capsulatus (strain H88) TaxID=544711 RepID=F0UAV5_AJEC8|nr:CP2 transcription factor [Histoplasma capsulatum var. duboisii H88]
MFRNRPTMDSEENKATEQTPKGLPDHWRFTPSIMDPNSYAFTSLANQPSTYYTATPTGMGISCHSQVPDLSTPGMTLNLLSPLSIPPATSATDAAAMQSAIDMNSFHSFPPHPANGVDSFHHPPPYTPCGFVNRDARYDPLHVENSPINGVNTTNHIGLIPHGIGLSTPVDNHPTPGGEKKTRTDISAFSFRFNVTLKAATAMVKDPDEIPITYLNKGQAYTMSVLDTAPMTSGTQPLKYRTYIRISFEDDEQRSKPASCWQLWKEGRGSNEAHHRDGKLLAVEHVDPNQGGDGDIRPSQVHLETSNFDGFSVIWSPNPATGNPCCSISVRFNFLSTDFSHSKGVKGIPVRLCAKTEVISMGHGDPPLEDRPEVCYCKVKLFRDHGAERKLSNDVAHVKKLIDKLKQQISQAELGSGYDRRKRSGSFVKGKLARHKRGWSGDSNNESGKSSLEDDLQIKLCTLKDMFSSTRPFSALNLKGDPNDDPDLFPVHLGISDETFPPAIGWESRNNADASSIASQHVLSPATSNHSLSSSHNSFDPKTGFPHQQQVYDGSRHDSMDWSSVSQQDSDSQQHISNNGRYLSHPVKVQKVSADGRSGNDGWIEAMDVDATYQPPLVVPKKPTSCFYVQIRQPCGNQVPDGYYHAVYLSQRTAKDLVHVISKKCKIDASRVVRALCLRGNGLHVILDDDIVNELPEGQDMAAEISEVRDCSLDASTDGDSSTTSTSSGIEVKLIF